MRKVCAVCCFPLSGNNIKLPLDKATLVGDVGQRLSAEGVGNDIDDTLLGSRPRKFSTSRVSQSILTFPEGLTHCALRRRRPSQYIHFVLLSSETSSSHLDHSPSPFSLPTFLAWQWLAMDA